MSNWHARRRVSRLGRATIIWETPSPVLRIILYNRSGGRRRRRIKATTGSTSGRGRKEKKRKKKETKKERNNEGIDADIQFSCWRLEAIRVKKEKRTRLTWLADRKSHPSGQYHDVRRLFYATRPVPSTCNEDVLFNVRADLPRDSVAAPAIVRSTHAVIVEFIGGHRVSDSYPAHAEFYQNTLSLAFHGRLPFDFDAVPSVVSWPR